MQALYDAADDDSATGGPDLTRRIFPVVSVITADGHTRLSQDQVAAIADQVVAGRHAAPRRPRRPPHLTHGGTDLLTVSMPFYVSPEQLMKDRADFARKGIARGRSVAVVRYADGVLFVSENPSAALHKISEIYDRIAFAAVGRYNEFENLRIAGVRLADMRGYSYDRRDVTGRGLANAYAQTLGTIFSSGGEKPYEIEIFVAEVGDSAEDDQIFRLTFDGQVVEEHDYAVMGGAAESVTTYLKERYAPGPLPRRGASRWPPRRWGRTRPATATSRPATSRSPCSTAPAPRSASSSGCRARCWSGSSATGPGAAAPEAEPEPPSATEAPTRLPTDPDDEPPVAP